MAVTTPRFPWEQPGVVGTTPGAPGFTGPASPWGTPTPGGLFGDRQPQTGGYAGAQPPLFGSPDGSSGFTNPGTIGGGWPPPQNPGVSPWLGGDRMPMGGEFAGAQPPQGGTLGGGFTGGGFTGGGGYAGAVPPVDYGVSPGGGFTDRMPMTGVGGGSTPLDGAGATTGAGQSPAEVAAYWGPNPQGGVLGMGRVVGAGMDRQPQQFSDPGVGGGFSGGGFGGGFAGSVPPGGGFSGTQPPGGYTDRIAMDGLAGGSAPSGGVSAGTPGGGFTSPPGNAGVRDMGRVVPGLGNGIDRQPQGNAFGFYGNQPPLQGFIDSMPPNQKDMLMQLMNQGYPFQQAYQMMMGQL